MQNYTVKILHDVEDCCVSVVRLQDCILKLGGVEDSIVEMQCSIEVAKDGIVQKLIDIAVAQDRVGYPDCRDEDVGCYSQQYCVGVVQYCGVVMLRCRIVCWYNSTVEIQAVNIQD